MENCGHEFTLVGISSFATGTSRRGERLLLLL